MIVQYQGGTQLTKFRCTECGEEFTRPFCAPLAAIGGRNFTEALQKVKEAESEITIEHLCKGGRHEPNE